MPHRDDTTAAYIALADKVDNEVLLPELDESANSLQVVDDTFANTSNVLSFAANYPQTIISDDHFIFAGLEYRILYFEGFNRSIPGQIVVLKRKYEKGKVETHEFSLYKSEPVFFSENEKLMLNDFIADLYKIQNKQRMNPEQELLFCNKISEFLASDVNVISASTRSGVNQSIPQ